MPNGYISQIQINGGDVQNIGSCAYAVCDTAEDVSVKVVTLPGFVLKDGATIHVKFMYRNTAFNPELNVNGTGAKSILLNTNLDFNSYISLSSQYNVDQLWLAGAVVTLTYDGTNWVVNNPSRITTPFAYNLGTGGTLEPDSYMILADLEWELCTGSSNVTARVFPFRICMSTMVDGIYRDRSAIMEVFVGGCYNKKDYVDIMIHDESEYHANSNYIFRSLVDSIFIYFEYEVSSGNVIGKRTGHLLGKIPASWSTFQLVPLTDMSVASANPDENHHFLKFDIAHSRSSFEPSETSQTSIPSGNVLPTTVGVHKYLIKARMKPFDVEQISGVLPISKGGTGATTAIGAEYNILNQVQNMDGTLTDTRRIAVLNQTKSSTNGVFRWYSLSNVWNWIKSKTDSLYIKTNFGGTFVDKRAAESNSYYTAPSGLAVENTASISRLMVTTSSSNVLLNADRKSGITITEKYPTAWGNSTFKDKYFDGGYGNSVTKDMSAATSSDPIVITVEGFSTATDVSWLKLFYHRFIGQTACLKIEMKCSYGWFTLHEFTEPIVYNNKSFSLLTASVRDQLRELSGNQSLYYVNVTGIRLTFHTVNGTYWGLSEIEIREDRNTSGANLGVNALALRGGDLYGKLNLMYDSGAIASGEKGAVTGNTVYQALLNKQDKLTLPLSISNGGTGGTTALNAEYNLITKPRSTELTTAIDDDKRIPFCHTSPSTSNGTFAGYRKASALWNYIKGKADAVYSTIADLANYYTKTEVDTALDGKRNLFSLTNSWIGQNLAGTTYGVACRFKITSVSEARSIFMRINARGVIHNLRIMASSSSLSIGDRQAGTNASDDGIYGHLDTTTGIVTIYLEMKNYREGASVTEFNPARYYYYNNRLTDVTFPDKESINTLPEGYVTAEQDGLARYDKDGNDISTYYQPVITAGTGLSKTDNTINHSNSVTAQTSDLGSYQRIPVIRYDAQGHITKGNYVSIFNKEKTSTIKVGYISNGSQSSNTGWFKVGEVTYWTGSYNRFSFIISVLGTNTNIHDYGLLRVRGVSGSTIGFILGLSVQWIVKTPSNGSCFTSDCIRLVKSDTSTSSGATMYIYMKLPVINLSYNFMMLNEANAGTSIKAFQFEFSNSTTKESVEPEPRYVSTMAPLELGNQSNCLEINDSNWQSYLTASNAGGAVPSNIANGDILTIPEGTTQIFFNTTNVADIALVRGEGSIGRFPRNGVRITIAGNWKPQENGGYSGGLADGRFSAWLYHVRYGVPTNNTTSGQLNQIFEDYIYFNGVWYSKGY